MRRARDAARGQAGHLGAGVRRGAECLGAAPPWPAGGQVGHGGLVGRGGLVGSPRLVPWEGGRSLAAGLSGARTDWAASGPGAGLRRPRRRRRRHRCACRRERHCACGSVWPQARRWTAC